MHLYQRGEISMKRALVLGGTRFFGKRLVEKLVENKWDVTVASRGLANDPFGDTINRLTINRYDTKSLQAALQTREWDVVYDQICYAPSDAIDTCELFSGRIGRYVLTSTGSVYKDVPMPYQEDHFSPYSYPLLLGRQDSFEYGEGKRLAEAVFFQKASFPVAAMRIPVVVGPDDYTQRLAGVVKSVMHGTAMRPPNLKRTMGFISSSEAAEFLYWLAESPVTGPYNAAATGSLTMQDLIALVERVVDRKAMLSDEAEIECPLQGSSYLDNSKSRAAGFVFSNLEDWLPTLVAELAKDLL